MHAQLRQVLGPAVNSGPVLTGGEHADAQAVAAAPAPAVAAECAGGQRAPAVVAGIAQHSGKAGVVGTDGHSLPD